MQRSKRQWTYKEFVSVLKDNGYRLDHKSKSSHQVYTNGKNDISVPFIKQNPMLINRLIKENNLKV